MPSRSLIKYRLAVLILGAAAGVVLEQYPQVKATICQPYPNLFPRSYPPTDDSNSIHPSPVATPASLRCIRRYRRPPKSWGDILQPERQLSGAVANLQRIEQRDVSRLAAEGNG